MSDKVAGKRGRHVAPKEVRAPVYHFPSNIFKWLEAKYYWAVLQHADCYFRWPQHRCSDCFEVPHAENCWTNWEPQSVQQADLFWSFSIGITSKPLQVMDLHYPYTYRGRSFEQGELILFKTDNLEVDKIQVDSCGANQRRSLCSSMRVQWTRAERSLSRPGWKRYSAIDRYRRPK